MLQSVHPTEDVVTDERVLSVEQADQPEELSDDQLQSVAGGPTMGSSGGG